MGKSRSKKYKVKSSNPTGLPSINDLEMEQYDMPFNITGTLESIVEKLQSRMAEDRECAAVIIANLAVSREFVRPIIENKVIRVAAPLLIDRNPSVRHTIAGCLRNIAVCGDYLVSEAMVEQDIMTSLVALLEQYKDPWTPVQKTKDTVQKTKNSVQKTNNKIDSKTEIFLEACNLLWSLCENSDVAVSIFNKKNLVSILLPCLNFEVYGLRVPLVVAQCLHTVGENNIILSDVLRQPLVEEQLKALMTLPPTKPEYVLLRTLAAGMKLNIFYGKLGNCMGDVTTSILDVVSSTFRVPTATIVELLSKQIVNHKAEKLNKSCEEQDLEDKFSAVNRTHEQLIHLLSAKQCALEILGKMFEDDDADDSDEWDDISSSDSNEVTSDMIDMDVDESDVSTTELGLKLPTEMYKMVVNENLLEKVLEQIVMPKEEVLNILRTHSHANDCLKRLDTVRCTALLCLTNIIQKFDVKDLGDASNLLDLWLNLGNLLFKETDLNNTDQVEAVTRSMSTVVRKLAETGRSSHFSHMTESDLELFINICRQSHDSRIKVHIIRVVGSIGCLLGSIQTPTASNLIKIIGSVLLEICSKITDMWVTAEALDVIFDVFAEDHVDIIAKEICLVEKLTHILPMFKGKIKQQRKSFGEHLPVIMTAKDNLLRFIKYKNEFNKK